MAASGTLSLARPQPGSPGKVLRTRVRQADTQNAKAAGTRADRQDQNANPKPRFSELPSVKCSSVSGSLCSR